MTSRVVPLSGDTKPVPHRTVVAPLMRLLMQGGAQRRPATGRVRLDSLQDALAAIPGADVEYRQADAKDLVLDVLAKSDMTRQ